MDFLSIRKKARERAKASEGATPAASTLPAARGPGDEPSGEQLLAPPGPAGEPVQPRTSAPAAPPGPDAPAPPRERRRGSGSETVLTERDLAEGALQARFRELAPAEDGRFATWRPGAGPPPVEPAFRELEPPPNPRPADEPLATTVPEPDRALARVPPEAPLAPRPEEADPLDAFFYRPDEEAAFVPLLGGPVEVEPAAPAPQPIVEFLTFLADKEEFGIPIEAVREVMRAPAITEVPRAPANVLGIVTVRGEVVVVLDARRRLGLGAPGSAGLGARIVIVDSGEGPLGLLVDGVSSVVRLPRGSIEPCPQGIVAADCVTGIGRSKDRLFMLIDVAMLLSRGRPAEAP